MRWRWWLFCQKELGELDVQESGEVQKLTSRDVEVFTPFEVDSITHSVIKTYLDTTGRPTVTLKKSRCTENHGETIYVSIVFS